MSYAVVDVETSIVHDGNPFAADGRLCVVGVLDRSGFTCYRIEYDETPYGSVLDEIRERLNGLDFWVGANIKFDLHWLRRYGINPPPAVFDTQLAEFVLSGQTNAYPSLNDCAEKYGFPVKLDVVQSDYWDVGIDTPDVPWAILSEYNEWDCRLTEKVFKVQRKLLTQKKLMTLYQLQAQDLLILEEMEWNGLKYDLKAAGERSVSMQADLAGIDSDLRRLVDTPAVNWGSSDHISAVLYGGVIYERYRETYTRQLKHGTKEVERWAERPLEFARLVTPPKRTEVSPTKGVGDAELASINSDRSRLGKRPYQRHWSTAEPVLRKLRAKGKAKAIIELLLKRAELEKLDSTYYGGLVAKHRALNWPDDTLHGQFNQCVAQTGRLSSSGPNLQNFAKDIKDLFYSRYAGA